MVMGTCSWYLCFAVACYLVGKVCFLHQQMHRIESEFDLFDTGHHLLQWTSWHGSFLLFVALDCTGHRLLADRQHLDGQQRGYRPAENDLKQWAQAFCPVQAQALLCNRDVYSPSYRQCRAIAGRVYIPVAQESLRLNRTECLRPLLEIILRWPIASLLAIQTTKMIPGSKRRDRNTSASVYCRQAPGPANAVQGLLHTRTCLEGRKRGQICVMRCKVTCVRLSGIEPGNVN